MSWHDDYRVWLTESQSLENAQKVVDHLYGNTDWSRESICALLGNMRHESSINPDMYEYGYAWSADRGYGLVQWTPRSKYWDWAVARGLNPRHGDSQLDRIDYEVSNNIQWIPRSDYGGMTFAQFRANTGNWSIAYLTEAFTWGYERPNTQAGWNSMPDRKSFASLAYNRLDWSGDGGGGPGPEPDPGDDDYEGDVEIGRSVSVDRLTAHGDNIFIRLSNKQTITAYPTTANIWKPKAHTITTPGGSGGDGDPGGDDPGDPGDPGEPPTVSGEWSDPLKNLRCTQAWGTTRWTSYHSGMDMGARTPGVPGDIMYAITSGTVVGTGGHNDVLAYNSGYKIAIDHGIVDGQRLISVYGHCDARNPFIAKVGDQVQAGDPVARMGGSGANHSNNDFAVHLHLVLVRGLDWPSNGRLVAGRSNTTDPETFLRSKGVLEGMNACPR